MLVMATLGVTMALGTVGMTAEAAAQTDKAQTNVQTQQAVADTKVQGESNLKLTTEWVTKLLPDIYSNRYISVKIYRQNTLRIRKTSANSVLNAFNP